MCTYSPSVPTPSGESNSSRPGAGGEGDSGDGFGSFEVFSLLHRPEVCASQSRRGFCGTIIIERESSGSSSEDDIRDARVYTVRKSHSDTEQAKPPPTPPVEDDPLGDIALLYTIQACLFGHFEPAILSGRVGARD